MNLSELTTRIESSYREYFPESKIFVEYSGKMYSSIWVRCFIAGAKTENSGNYWDNDMMRVSFRIQGENGQELPDLQADSELPNLSIENHAKSYHIKPDSIYLVYENRRMSYRKTTGTPEKIVASLDMFFKSLQAQILQDYTAGRIHANHTEIVKIKLDKFIV